MINLDEVVITVDKDVPTAPVKRKRGVDETNPQVMKIRALALGDSFFIEGEDKKSVRPLIDLGRKIGCRLVARDIKVDEIYGSSGVRIWREERKAKDQPARQTRYWHHPESCCVLVTGPGHEEDFSSETIDPLLVEIDEDQYKILKAQYEDDL